MIPEDNDVLIFQIVLPLLIALLLTLSPRPWTLAAALSNARLSEENGHFSEAANQVKVVIGYETGRIDLWQKMASLYIQAGQMRDAIHSLEYLAGRGRLSVSDGLALADAYAQTEDMERAVQQWNRLINLPDPPDQAFERLYQHYLILKNFQKAAEVLQAWLNVKPYQAQVSFDLGLILVVNQPEEAMPYLDRAAKLSANFGPWILSVKNALLLGNRDLHDSYRLVIIGRALGNLGRWDLALWAFELATAADPDYPAALAFLGEARQRQGLDGYRYLDEAMKMDPQSILAQALMGVYWNRQGRPENAYVSLSRIVEMEPDQAIWQVEIANALAQMGDVNSAYLHYQKAVDLESGNPAYLRLLAQFCVNYQFEINRCAVPAARQAVLISPDDPQSLDMMGWVLYAVGDLNTAERFCLRALEQDKKYPLAYQHLGQIYLQRGNMEKSYFYLSSALEFAGKDDEVRFITERLMRRYFWGDS